MSVLRRLVPICAMLALALGATAARAQPVCVDPGGLGGSGAPVAAGGSGGTGATAAAPGMGGTGAPMAAPGIGGTGAPVAGMPGGFGGTGDAARGGIGGTGAPVEGGVGGTGIVGTITGFASICVNGFEVHFDEGVPVSENGSAATVARLAVGQVVAVEAAAGSDGLRARQISILNAYEGPLTADGRGNDGTLRVMGQPVRLAPGAQLDAGVRAGDNVRVSGLRNADGEVIATRVERAAGLREASALGQLEAPDRLHGLGLDGAIGMPGDEVLVRGQWAEGRLRVTTHREDPSLPFVDRVRNASVEGLVAERNARELRIAGFRAELAPDTQFAGGERDELGVGRRVRIHGTFSGPREIQAARVEFVSDRWLSGESRPHGAAVAGDDATRSDDEGKKTRMEDDRMRIEVESESGSERIERRYSDDGQLERERIEREVTSPTGELLLRERVEVRDSGGRTETRERIEIYEGGRRVERIERIDRVERVDRPDKVDRPEKIERPDRIERPDDD